jgi:hypothetical protein
MVDDALSAIEKHLPLDTVGRPVVVLALDPLPVNLFTKDMKPDGLEAIAGIGSRPTPVSWTVGKCIAVREVSGIRFGHAEHYANIGYSASSILANRSSVQMELRVGQQLTGIHRARLRFDFP